jgi:hypothetical protein
LAAAGSLCVAAWSVAIAGEPPLPFGAVIYRARKIASFESLGVTIVACRHRDPTPRNFAIDFFDPMGKQVRVFGPSFAHQVPTGKKIIFVTNRYYSAKRDVIDVRLAHLTSGTARVVSDARTVRCLGKIRFDGGARSPSRMRDIGLFRASATPAPEPEW